MRAASAVFMCGTVTRVLNAITCPAKRVLRCQRDCGVCDNLSRLLMLPGKGDSLMRSTLVAVGILVTLSVPAHATAQSLGEIAKKTAADKAKGDPQAAKTYTNADLKSDPTAPVPRDASGTTPVKKSDAAEGTSTDADKSDSTDPAPAPKKTEVYWRERMAPLQEKLADDMHSASLVQHNLVATKAKLDATLPSLVVFGPEIVKLQNELNTWNTLIGEDNAAIDALKEEGRRAGALPGWFR